MDQVSLARLHLEVSTARSAGVVHVLVRHAVRPPSADLITWLDSVLADVGFKPLSGAWREISRPDAVSVVQNILHRDLAYRAEIMPAWLAAALATRFCDLRVSAKQPHAEIVYAPRKQVPDERSGVGRPNAAGARRGGGVPPVRERAEAVPGCMRRKQYPDRGHSERAGGSLHGGCLGPDDRATWSRGDECRAGVYE